MEKDLKNVFSYNLLCSVAYNDFFSETNEESKSESKNDLRKNRIGFL